MDVSRLRMVARMRIASETGESCYQLRSPLASRPLLFAPRGVETLLGAKARLTEKGWTSGNEYVAMLNSLLECERPARGVINRAEQVELTDKLEDFLDCVSFPELWEDRVADRIARTEFTDNDQCLNFLGFLPREDAMKKNPPLCMGQAASIVQQLVQRERSGIVLVGWRIQELIQSLGGLSFILRNEKHMVWDLSLDPLLWYLYSEGEEW